eukprot:scaffold22283_cov57-Phaeocystis_antarctica.AAC.1
MSPEYMASLATLKSHEGRFTSELTHRVRNDWWCESFNVMPYPPTACYTGLMTHGQALPSQPGPWASHTVRASRHCTHFRVASTYAPLVW